MDRPEGLAAAPLRELGAFALSLGHALLVGTDLQGLGGPLLALLAAGPVIWLVFYRLLVGRTAPRAVAAPSSA